MTDACAACLPEIVDFEVIRRLKFRGCFLQSVVFGRFVASAVLPDPSEVSNLQW